MVSARWGGPGGPHYSPALAKSLMSNKGLLSSDLSCIAWPVPFRAADDPQRGCEYSRGICCIARSDKSRRKKILRLPEVRERLGVGRTMLDGRSSAPAG